MSEVFLSGRDVRILQQIRVASNYREMILELKNPSAPNPRPGQFFTLGLRAFPLTLLRRPFAYSFANEQILKFVYEIRGRETQALSLLKEGDFIDLLGPLGTWFPTPVASGRPVLIAGGAGVGPIQFLAEFLSQTIQDVLVILGGQNENDITTLKWPANVEVRICTDDGTLGIRGTVLTALNDKDISRGIFYSCGPLPMMKAVHCLAVQNERPSYVSMEEIMACGIGACQGCPVSVTSMDDSENIQYKRVCFDGPVFESREIVWT